MINKQGMIDRFGEPELIQRTDRAEPPTNAIVDAVLDRAIADARAFMDAYIAVKYDVALASDLPVIERIAGDLARFNLYDDGAPESVQLARDEALKFLKDISLGRATLDLIAAPTPDTGAGVQHVAPARIFSRDSLSGY